MIGERKGPTYLLQKDIDGDLLLGFWDGFVEYIEGC
jgi:hypothetical protein